MTDTTQRYGSEEVPEPQQVEAKRPCLIMIRGDFVGQVNELEKDVIIIGRSDDADLVMSDVSISRKHAMLVNRIDGFYLSDLGSTNGCWLNKDRVKEPTRLSAGDKITLGNIAFKFDYQDEDDTQYHLMLLNMAIKDGLTRVFNKRYFSESLRKEFEFSRRSKISLAVIMFDIDHFKQINDTWGHPAGDHVLKHLAQLVANEARGYDLFARYGGEEFVFLARGSTEPGARAVAERVRTAIEGHVFDYDGVDLKVTVSLGIGWWSGEDDSVECGEEILAIADKQLYEAKDAGRNCVRP